jgi:hypothetical protein
METLVVHAVSLESAQEFCAALPGFRTNLVGAENGRFEVQITFAGDREIIAVLNALVEYVTNRGDGPARLELDGHRYTLPPQPGLNEPTGVGGEDEPEPQRETAGTDG